MNKIRGVIFDLDGVLVDTEYYQWQGWVEVLKPYGVSLSKEEYFDYAGKRGDIIESELMIKYGIKVEKGELLRKKENLLINWFESKELKLMPFAREALELLEKNKKYKLAVASGGPEKEVILKLKKTNLYSFFQVIASGSEVKNGKPYPDIYLLALEKLELKADECVALEDTQYGLEAATGAGLTCLAIPNEYSVKQNFSKAYRKLNDLRDAVEFLHNN